MPPAIGRRLTPLLLHRRGGAAILPRLLCSSSSPTTGPPPGGDEPEAPSPTSRISVDLSGLYNQAGPISVAEYMAEVLTNPKSGFYINEDVFGEKGDFITSEVSQMFGEMIGVWSTCLWEQMGQSEKVNLVELGPGRGTLIADLLRGTSKCQKFTKSLQVHLVECSPALMKLQYNALQCRDEVVDEKAELERTYSNLTGGNVTWHASLEEVPQGLPTIIIAHEFYDALPIHQFQPTPCALLYLKKCCKWARTEELGKLNHIEVCPGALDLTRGIAKRISADCGGALIIDYSTDGIISDSLQAIQKHKFVNILDNPGTADLSAYVDFDSIRHSAEGVSDNVPITQSQFLGCLGINFHMEALLQNCTDEQDESLRNGYWQLVGEVEAPFWERPDDQTPIGMGSRYLAMAVVNKLQGVPVPSL